MLALIGVSPGYVNNPAENFKRFSVFPQTGEIVYKTGDLGKYDENGNIIFLGRDDLQVEISGKRIE
ncbi:MAG: AMP-binding protein, partial [Clostridia bacterium]|nr:AMP-binding protein [Clostridia bacterium]